MNNLNFNYVTTDEEVKEVETLAQTIWHEHYKSLLSKEQREYMLNKFQSYASIKNSIINEGYKYYLISYNNEIAGYIGIKEEDYKLFLSKLYLLKKYRHKGIGKSCFNFLKNICYKNNLYSIYLTVNKHNDSSIKAYKASGFKTIDCVISPIGNDYIMDDYIMELTL